MSKFDRLVLLAGIPGVAASLAYRSLSPRLGSPTFFFIIGVSVVAYLVVILRLFLVREPPARSFVVAGLLFAAAFRAPFLLGEPGDDVYRYVWDARVQRLGYNPYIVVPADPKLAELHTAETRRINHPELPTPYPPGAQVFFRTVFAVSDRAYAFKLALALIEVGLVLMLWRWLRAGGQHAGWLLAYAWNPLVVLVTAGEGHLDALGAFWLVTSLALLTNGSRLSSMLCFAMAVSTKPVPLVLLPLFWRRVRLRDAAAAIVLVAALYVPYLSRTNVPVGSLGTFAFQYRFNQTLFALVRVSLGPRAGIVAALIAGLAVAAIFRARARVTDPEAWAWPMAVTYLMSPVVYPWYLVWLAAFFTSRATLPLLVWSISILSTYVVWHLSDLGLPWRVPAAALIVEFGALVSASAWVVFKSRHLADSPEPLTTKINVLKRGQ